eukprot:1441662-Alexandrium_andersonii.AAC.1
MAHTGERTTLCESQSRALAQPRVLWVSSRGTFKESVHRHMDSSALEGPRPREGDTRRDGLSCPGPFEHFGAFYGIRRA